MRRPDEEPRVSTGPGLEEGTVESFGLSEAVGEKSANAGRVAGVGESPRERLVTAGEHREPELAGRMEAEREDSVLVGERVGVEKLDADSADTQAVVVDEGLALAGGRGARQTLGLEGA